MKVRARMGSLAVLAAAAVGVATSAVATAGAAPRPHGTPVATYDPKAAKLVPASIKSLSAHGGLIEAFDASYPPDEFLASNDKTIIGFDVQLGTAIATTLGLKFVPRNITFDSIIPKLLAGSVNVGNSSFTDTVKRQTQVNFVDYFVAGEAFYVPHNSSLVLNSLAALCGHTVAVETGTVEESDATAQSARCPAGKKIKVSSYPTQSAANSAVASGRQQAGFADSQVAGYIVQQSHGVFKLAGKAINIAPYGFALSKKTTFDKAIEAAVNDLIKNGVYNAILTKWGVQAGEVSHAAINDPTLGAK